MIKSVYAFILFGLCCSFESHADLIVNELMPVPNGTEPEWVEIYNISEEAYYQDYLILCDIATCRSLHGFFLEAKSYCIITKDTVLFKEYRPIDPNVRLYQFNIPTLNNTFDSLKVFNKDTVLLDAVFYDMKHGIKGVSLERVYQNLPAITPGNLKPCIDNSGATPGERNSVFPVEYDLAVSRAAQNSDDFTISILIENLGIKPITSCRALIYIDTDFDENFEISELIFDSEVQINDEVAIIEIDNKLSKDDVYSAFYNLKVEVLTPKDDNTQNNFAYVHAFMKARNPKITFNEIMFETSAGTAEYLEFYNHESQSVRIEGFKLFDRAVLWSQDYSFRDIILPPNDYFVVAYDSTIFENFGYLSNLRNVYIPVKKLTLNNSDDLLVMALPDNTVIDSLTYFSKWHINDDILTKDRSLEKINIEMLSFDKLSWTTCLEPSGGTPGLQNSTYIEIVRDGILTVSPNPFSPNLLHEGNHCLISYNLTFESAKISAKIYDLSANPVRTILMEHWTSNEGFFAWDGRDDSGIKLPVGPYILYFEAIESPPGDAYFEKVMVVIAE